MEKLNSTVKLCLVFGLSVLIFWLSPTQLAFLAAALLIFYWLLKLSLTALYRNLKALSILVFMALLAQFILAGGEPLYQLGFFKITQAGLENTVLFLGRVVVLVVLGTALSETTSPTELAGSLENLLFFLKPFRLPVSQLALSLSLAWRFVPMLFSEADQLRKALKVRGVEFKGSLKGQLRYWRWLILPLMVNLVRQAEELALAMEMRGFGVSPFFTFEKGSLNWRDGLAILLVVVGILVLLRLVR